MLSRPIAMYARVLGRSVLHQPVVGCCNGPFSASTAHVQVLTPLSNKFRTSALPKFTSRALHSNQFSILQFRQTSPWKATHLDHKIPWSAGGGQKPPGRSRTLDDLPPPIIFWGILAANVGVFMAWYYAENTYKMMRDSRPYLWMQHNFTVSLDNVKSGRIWTPLTCCFSQSDTTHLLFNGFTYFFMARPVLAMLGNKQFLILYLGGGLIASMTSLVWNQDKPLYASHGASGAIYAVLSYFTCRKPTTTFLLFAILPVPAWAFVPGVLLYDLYEMLVSRRVTKTDTAGHVGGIFAGILYFLSRRFGIRL